MSPSRLALAFTVASFTLLQACSSSSSETPQQKEDDAFNTPTAPTFVDQAINVDRHFADSVDATSPTQLTVPNDGNTAILANVKVGTILAGDRNSTNTDITTSPNAYGFLRRVTGIQQSGASTVLTTVPAELDEWIKSGDLDFSNPNSIFTTTTSEIGTKNLHVLDDGTGGGSGSASAKLDQTITGDEKTSSTGIKVRPTIKLANMTLKLNAKYDGYFKVRTTLGFPRSAQFKSLLTIDPVISGDLTVGVSVTGQGPLSVGTVNGITIAATTQDGASVPIVIPAPIPLTVRFLPRLKCSLGASGTATGTVTITLTSHAAVGFQGDATVSGVNTTDLSTAPTLNPSYSFKGAQVQETVTAECAMLAVPEVLAFDAAGLSGEMGPFVDLNLNACANYNAGTDTVDGGYTITEQHGLEIDFAGRIQLPVVGIGKDFPLGVTIHTLKSDPFYIYGDKTTCALKTKDSCDGRADGFYCSVVNTYSGINCKGGQVLSGLQCADTSKKCASGTTTAITCN